MNRFALLMTLFPFALYACGDDDSGGGGGGSGGKKDAGVDSGKGGTGGGTGATGGVSLGGGTGGGGTGGNVAGAAGVAGVAGAAGGGGVAGGVAGGGGTAGATGGVAGADSGLGGTDSGVGGNDGGPVALGDACQNPFIVGTLPYSQAGDTTGAGPDYGYTGSSCPPMTSSAGSAANDQVYEFTPVSAGRYLVEMKTTTFDGNLYVVTDCSNVDASCVGGLDKCTSDCTETVSVDALAGTPYYIIADGYQTSGTPAGGTYTIDVKPAPENETCATAIPITTVPYMHSSNTTGAAGDYGFSAAACPGTASAKGTGTSDLVYAFTPATSGKYDVAVDTASFDAALYVATNCASVDTSCLAGTDDCSSDCTEKVTITATAGTTYYIFVDGYQTSSDPGNAGTYTLSIDVTPPPPAGDTCATAIVVGALPYSASGNTTGASADYGYAAGACLPETDGWGDSSSDIVYSFTPTVTGSYTITLGGFDSTLYVVTNCADVDNSCVAGDESCITSCDETVTTNLTAGTPYFIIVDGYSNFSNVAGAYQLDIVKNP